MTDDLVKWLREKAFRTETYELVNAAADRIEKLEAALRKIEDCAMSGSFFEEIARKALDAK
jgi:hypothetical protein